MPVTLEEISQPSEQDLIDLEKIYQDYPSDLRWGSLQGELQENPRMQLYAARFNARLLAAISCTVKDSEIHLNHLCVRKVTRQRHVGRDLLRLLMAEHPNKKIHFQSCIDPEVGLSALFIQAGFNPQGCDFIYQPRC